MPVNASVEDYKDAIKDLQATGSSKLRILKEIERLKEAAKLNRKRERNVYGKMFFSSTGDDKDDAGEE